MPDAAIGLAFPPALAGLVVGGWRLEEPGRAPSSAPWPGLCQARAPLAWYDSLEVRSLGGGAFAGFGGALAGLRGRTPTPQRQAHSTFSLANGSGGLDENALTLARGDSLRSFGLDVASGKRGAMAGLERAGRHQWGGRAKLTRGHHELAASFAQRGEAAQLADDEEQAGRGQSGSASWRWHRGGTAWTGEYARGLDRHSSFGGGLLPSEREAQETRLAAGFTRAREGRILDARLEWADESVRRFDFGAFARESRSLWGAVRTRLPLAGGRLELAMGAGRHGGVERFDVAPSATFDVRLRGLDATLAVERLLTPVWADLAPGFEPFVQRAWMGTMRVVTARPGALTARASLRAGRVYSRALAERLPLEELWLRHGLSSEFGTYDLALGEGGCSWAGRHGDVGLEGFGLAHHSSGASIGVARARRADPDAGFRAWLGGRTRLFGGDLGVALRGEVAGVGARERQVEELQILPAFVTYGLVCELALGDVTIVVSGRNLEDRPREQPWTDVSTGLPEVTGRRDVALNLVWRLFN